jgi:beta-lactamase regulating signal transducer with metallopeptidase domain
MILLSVVFTFIAFMTSQFLMRRFKVTNAKNRSGILMIVMLTAFSIFSFTIIAATSDYQNNLFLLGDANPIPDEYSSIIVVVEETDMKENSTIDNKNVITNSNYNSLDNLRRNSFPPYYKITTFIPNVTSFQNNILSEIIKQYQTENSQLTNKFYVNPGKIDISTNVINPIDEKLDNEKIEPLFLFIILNIFLVVFSLLYLIFSFIFGKKLIMKRYKPKRSKDPFINRLVSELSDELKIKKMRIYLYDGTPNAFVFGFPASIAISTKLISYLSKKELTSAIRHELAHIKNNDILIKLFLQIMRIIFFYNPVVHILYYKILNERELIADSLFINSKDEKITLIETLIKIHKHTNQKKILSQAIINSYSLSLIAYNSKKLEITDRFNHLFGKNTKKSFYSIMICLIILISNISMIAIANKVLDDSIDITFEDEFIVEDLNIDDKNLYSNHVKYVFRVFEEHHPELYKKCIIYYVLIDIKNNNLTPRDLVGTVKLLIEE